MATVDPAAPALAGDAHLSLFTTEAFNALNLAPGQRLRRLDHVADGRLVGSLVGVVEGDEFHSGHSAPFGGPDFVRDAETARLVGETLAAAVARLEGEGDPQRSGSRPGRPSTRAPRPTSSSPCSTWASPSSAAS